MAWLLDTNVLSELRKAKPAPKVVAFVSKTPVKDLYVSSVTLAEIRFGTSRVLEVTEEIVLEWRRLVEEGRKINHTFSQPDLFIAAIALHHDLTIVTRNQKDFDKTRVAIFNPWGAN